MTVSKYILRRLLYAVVVVWGAFTAAFFLLYAVPGDAAGGLTLGADGGDIEQTLAEQRELLGLNRPLHVQYFDALFGALRGDFGESIYQRRPATEIFFESFGSTIELAATGLILAVILGVSFAIFVELVQWKWAREFLTSVPPIAVSIPPFVVALVAVQLFAFRFGWINSFGDKTFLGLVIASSSIAVAGAGQLAQLLLVNLRAAMTSPYIETARNWGLSHFDLVFRHALRTASLPVITALGTTVGVMVGGTVLTETVFSRLGIGRLIVDAVDGRDMPIVLISVSASALIFVVVNLAVDLIYPLIDPRIKLER